MTEKNGRGTKRSGFVESAVERLHGLHKTLIVDGNKPYRTALRKILSNEFPLVKTAEASSASQALAMLGKFNPNILMLSIQLPGTNGLDLARQIRNEHPELIIILISRQDLPEYRAAVKKSGIDYLIARDSWSGADIIELFRSILTPGSPHQSTS